MNEAPKKIWVDDGMIAWAQYSEDDIPYIRADIGDELVDLLKDVLEEYLIQDEVSEGYGYGVGGEIREKARAALAKARGESHD